ncbi:MAG: UDP-2,3-diacylglucosamine diphosphatase LpxI [Clostridiales bacterium]|nr:UDP-2,3-diacylglucosamine diphosphatase LpxI [Clostridiales bacterium]
MGERIGILAGQGAFVSWALSELKGQGFACVVAGIEGEAESGLESRADVFEWVKPGDAAQVISFLKSQGVRTVMMLGKVRPGLIFKRSGFDAAAAGLWDKIEEKSPAGIIRAVIEFFEEKGLRVVSPEFLLQPRFCHAGVLTAEQPGVALVEDVDFGLRMAKRLADLEVGQTVIIKEKAIVAVEGMEGTDQTITRGGELAGPGFVAAKAGRTRQDLRIDVPAVGLATVQSLVRAGGAGLGLEAGNVAFFEKEEAIELANAHGLHIVVREVQSGGG